MRYTTTGILPPLGLAYIASHLERGKHQVNIIDLDLYSMSDLEIQNFIHHYPAEVYGISSTLFGFSGARRFAGLIKKNRLDSLIVLGGQCAVLSPRIIMARSPEFDVIVGGEGELSMLELCDALENRNDLIEVRGIFYRDQGEIVATAPAPLMENLDDNPFPARHLLPNSSYRLHPPFGLYSPVTTMETSRGCVANCIFCVLYHRPYRTRSAGNIVDEIEVVTGEYGVKEIYFVDPSFNASEERVMEISEEIMRRGIKVAWTCKFRVDRVSRKPLRMMERAGCYMISYGVESGSQQVLNNLRKGTTVDQIERAIRLSREAGIRSIAYLMLGNPGETDDTIRTTMKLMNRLRPDFVLYAPLTPDPGSELFQVAVDRGILDEDCYEKLLFSELSAQWPLYATKELSRSEIIEWIKAASRAYYLNPGYWRLRLSDIRGWNDIRNLSRGLFLLLSDLLFSKNVVEY